MKAPPPSSSSSSAVSKTPCCSKAGIKRGPWTAEEDEILSNFVQNQGVGRWRTLPNRAGLKRCGKSCRLRWMNYLRPSIKRGPIAPDEEDLILRLHRLLGNRWSLIAGRIPGRTDNEIKNYWNSHLSKKLIRQGIDPRTHKPLITSSTTNVNSNSINPNFQKVDHNHQSSTITSNPHHPLIPQTSTATPKSLEIAGTSNNSNSQFRNTSIPSDDGNQNTDGNSGSGNDEFLLFLDSLINDGEVSNHQLLQPEAADDSELLSSLHPITTQSFDLGNWEAEFSSVGNKQNGSSSF